jgi:hypothetical protein
MDSRNLDLAAEFCKLVGSPNLLEYLGLSPGAEPGEARAKLKSRRKFMQGMQGNPKYKKEALFLIKHFSALNDVLGNPEEYLSDARRRAESEHLPVLEMTIRGVLAAGGLNAEQEAYLRRNAVELGVSEQTFREMLARLASEAGVPLKGGLPTPPPPPGRDGPDAPIDLYQLLGVAGGANQGDIDQAYERRVDEIRSTLSGDDAAQMLKRVEIARKVLSNQAARQHYDMTAARTGPPARSRDFRPDLAATAPPVRPRQSAPSPDAPGARGAPARLEILGDPVRPLRLRSGISVATIVIRNGGDHPMGGVVRSDAEWLAVDPTRLDPTAKEQEISIQVDGDDVPDDIGTGVVTIQTDKGQVARVVFELNRGPSWALLAALAMTALLLLAIGVGLLLQVY